MTHKKYLGYALGAFIAFAMAASFLFLGTANVHAQNEPLSADGFFGDSATGADFAGQAGLGSANLTDTIAQIIRVALGFLGIVAVVIILMGGFRWMTAGGNDDKVKEAKKIIISGVIGLVIVLSAYAIASFVIGEIAGQTQVSGETA
jgi:Zn-dependent protease with chaperone function